jgi:hypothetical protein
MTRLVLSVTSAPRRSSRPFRSSVAACALLLVGTGAALPHTAEIGLPGHEHALQETRVADRALHPAAPAHVEASGARLHPPCIACWLQARTLSLLAARASTAPAMPHTPGVQLLHACPSSRVAVGLAPARASPAAAPA